MRKHTEPTVTKDTRLSIFTCSSGTAWKLLAGKHPFGKAGGTRGSVANGRDGATPRIPWVDAEVVGGSKRGDRELVEEALRIANVITTTDSGPAFAWGLAATRRLHAVLRIEDEKEFIRAVEQLVGEWGKEHAREHKHEMSLYPSMPPSRYRLRERERRGRIAKFMPTAAWLPPEGGKRLLVDEVSTPVAVMEEVRIVPVATVMSDGSIIPSLNSDDCIQ